MKFRGCTVMFLFAFVSACGGGSGSNDNESIIQEGALDTSAGIELEPEPEPETRGAPGDTNGNGIADPFESTENDTDGDFISDLYDTDFVSGEDLNGNGIVDIFEGGYDPNQDGLNDLFLAAEERNNVPLPVALDSTDLLLTKSKKYINKLFTPSFITKPFRNVNEKALFYSHRM